MKKFYLGQIKDDNNVLAIFVGRIDGDSIGFYDSNGNLIAEWNPPVPLKAAEKYSDRAPSFLTQIDSLWQDILKNGTPIEERSREIEAVADALDLNVEDILSISSFKTSQHVAERHTKHTISTEKEQHKETSQNPNLVTDSVYAKSEIALDKLVDDRYTLGDILGVPDPNATLICVDSCDISGKKRSNSQFSFLIKYPDGRLEQAPMLSQEDGTSPDRDIYAANRDGSDIDKIIALSMYRVHSPLGDFMISATYGVTGTLNLQLGKRDITEQDFMAVPLEDQKYTRYVTKEVQELLDPERGIYHTDHMTNEIEKNIDTDTSSDGSTGGSKDSDLTQDPDENYYLTIAAEIWEAHPEMENLYNDVYGLSRDLKNFILEHPDQSVEDFIDDRTASCDHYDRFRHH